MGPRAESVDRRVENASGNQEAGDATEEQEAHLHRIEFWRMIRELHLQLSDAELSGLRSKLEAREASALIGSTPSARAAHASAGRY